jgi:hypothetical protein
MRITKKDAADLDRFGCAFLPVQNLVCIRWPSSLQSAGSANIIVRLIHYPSTCGPFICLAFEISRTRALPQYCFFPFDLRSQVHTKFISALLQKGMIQLCFIRNSGQIQRIHELTSRQCAKMTELFATACDDATKFPDHKYDFDRAVTEFEQRSRLVDYFQYLLTDSEFQQVISLSHENAAKTTPEDRAEAASIKNELLELFGSQHKNFVRELTGKIPSIRRNLLFCLEMQKQFEGDYDGFANFLVAVMAGHAPNEDQQNLRAAIPFLGSVLSLIDHLTEDTGKDKQARDVEFREIMSRIASQGWSFEMLRSVASVLGFQGGRPGRPVKDYSTEYELRAAGKKWREVAEYNLENDAETRQEFGGRAFRNLSVQEKSILMHRVKEGLRSFAKRTGKLFPPEVQKNAH